MPPVLRAGETEAILGLMEDLQEKIQEETIFMYGTLLKSLKAHINKRFNIKATQVLEISTKGFADCGSSI